MIEFLNNTPPEQINMFFYVMSGLLVVLTTLTAMGIIRYVIKKSLKEKNENNSTK